MGTASEDETIGVGRPPTDAPEPPARVGRYRVGAKLGEGGMGVVYRAYDDELERELALKSVKASRDPEALARLAREAQAMASLSHPGIVPVYDIVVDEGALWIAMELVDGIDLRRWSREHPTQWRVALRLLLCAGRGLAAAHAAGILHRDVKPTNIVVDRGAVRARMLDFGLATSSDDPESSSVRSVDRVTHTSLEGSETGSLMGTPAYMAPELLDGRPASERSDQFAFCMAAFEVLHGRRPGADSGRRAWDPAEHQRTHDRVPRAVHAAVVRGLRHDPDARWPSIDALLRALERGVRKRRHGAMLGSVAVGAAAIGVGLFGNVTQKRCASVDLHAWDASTRGDIARDHPDVAERIDAFAEAFTRARADVCETGTSLDLQIHCLRAQEEVLVARLEMLREGVDDPAGMVEDLPDPAACADAAAVASQQAGLSPELKATIDALRPRLESMDALSRAGKTERALQLAEALERDTAQLDYAPVRTRILEALVNCRQRLGHYEAAIDAALEGFELASAAHLYDEAASFALFLTHLYGHRISKPEEGLHWSEQADALAPRTSDPKLTLAKSAFARGTAMVQIPARAKDGIAELERARALFSQAFEDPTSHEAVFYTHATLGNLGVAYYRRGRVTEAREAFQRAYEIVRAGMGPEHSETGSSAMTLAGLYHAEERWDDAIEVGETALRVLRETQGEFWATIGLEALILDARVRKGELPHATEELEALHERMSQTPGIPPSQLAEVELLIAHSARLRGTPQVALEWSRSALHQFEQTYGLDAAEVAGAHVIYAEALVAAERPDEARRHLQQAIDAYVRHTVPENPSLIDARARLAALEP